MAVTVTSSELDGPLVSGWIDLSGFATEGAAANRFTGSDARRVVFFREHELYGQTFHLTPALDATVAGGEPGSGPSYLQVMAGAKLRLAAGTFVKVPLEVRNGGTLEANGTASEPVIFTSLADDSVGGDTGGASSTTPSAGESAGIGVTDGGVATLVGTTIRYALTALDVADGGEATIHGEIVDSTVGVRSETFVDATEVDWGDPSGPAPIETGTPIEGDGVFVLPWVGYIEPPHPAYSPGPSLEFADCRKFIVIGARGSGEEPQGDPPVYTDNADGFGGRNYDAYYGFKDYLSSYGYNDSDFKVLGLRYDALGVSLVNIGTQAYFESIYEGVDHLIDALYDQSTKCPSQRAILVGYSQGALVIHLALRQLQDQTRRC